MKKSLVSVKVVLVKYPSMVKDCLYGKCLVSTKDLPIGTIIQKYKGKIVTRDKIPDDQITYALLFDASNWVIVETPARYANHSCDPNCDINDDLEIVTIKPVRAGEELTISYNVISEESYDYTKWDYFWDTRWTFKCQCGNANCQGIIDKYVKLNGDPLCENLITRFVY